MPARILIYVLPNVMFQSSWALRAPVFVGATPVRTGQRREGERREGMTHTAEGAVC